MIDLDAKGFDSLIYDLAATEDEVRDSIIYALRATIRTLRRRIAREAGSQYNIDRNLILGRLKLNLRRARTGEATLRVFTWPYPAILGYPRKGERGMSVKMGGQQQTIPGSFTARTRGRLSLRLFRRRGRERRGWEQITIDPRETFEQAVDTASREAHQVFSEHFERRLQAMVGRGK